MRDPGLKAQVALIFRSRQVVTGGRRILLFVFPQDVPFRASSTVDENMKYLTGKCWTTRVLEALFLGDVVLGDHLKSDTLIQQANKGARGAVRESTVLVHSTTCQLFYHPLWEPIA